MDAPEYRLHPLKGGRRGRWSVRVGGNWRIVFRFEDFEAVGVDLIAGRSAPPCGFRSPLSGIRETASRHPGGHFNIKFRDSLTVNGFPLPRE